MMAPRKSASDERSPGPGRPKDPAKRAAILDSATRMFTAHGFDGVSMDEIAADAGVSKLTVYSHFVDKETLFAAAVKSHCEQGLPSALFQSEPDVPVRERLLSIARAFFAMVTTPEAIAGHRMLCTPQLANTPLSRMFWDAGPRRVQDELATLLQRRVEWGELEIDDVPRAAAQFFVLVKGEPHARRVFGCDACGERDDAEAHLAASVDLFLRAYGTAPARDGQRRPPAR